MAGWPGAEVTTAADDPTTYLLESTPRSKETFVTADPATDVELAKRASTAAALLFVAETMLLAAEMTAGVTRPAAVRSGFVGATLPLATPTSRALWQILYAGARTAEVAVVTSHSAVASSCSQQMS